MSGFDLIRPTIMTWNGRLTSGGPVAVRTVADHNRASLSVSYEEIKKESRMWDGTLRKHVIAIKRTFSCSWNLLPSREITFGNSAGKLVGGGLNAIELENFYKYNPDEFEMKLYNGSDTLSPDTGEPYMVMMNDFSKEVVKRGRIDLWNITIGLIEL